MGQGSKFWYVGSLEHQMKPMLENIEKLLLNTSRVCYIHSMLKRTITITNVFLTGQAQILGQPWKDILNVALKSLVSLLKDENIVSAYELHR